MLRMRNHDTRRKVGVVHEYLFYEKEKCVDLIMYYCFWVELEGVKEVVMI